MHHLKWKQTLPVSLPWTADCQGVQFASLLRLHLSKFWFFVFYDIADSRDAPGKYVLILLMEEFQVVFFVVDSFKETLSDIFFWDRKNSMQRIVSIDIFIFSALSQQILVFWIVNNVGMT